jgi:glycosyltransferase involved in cell wall biosynthesis
VRNKTFLSVVVYTRNDLTAICDFVRQTGTWLQENFELYEIVVVDDASTVNVLPQIAETATSCGVNVVAIQLARRHGVEAGIKAGLDRALGDWIFELESAHVDFELDVLQEMYRWGSEGNDIVTASGDKGSLRSRLFYRFVNYYAELDTPLRTERVRLTSRRTLNAMLAMHEKVRYRKAMYAVLGHQHHHLTYHRTTTGPQGPTPKRDRETSSLAFDILLSFSGFGMRIAHRLSFAFGAFSVSTVVYAIVIYMFKNDVPQGWTTITVLTSGGFAGLFLVLGLLGEYIARILIEVRARPHYSIRDTLILNPPNVGTEAVQEPPAFLLREMNDRE